MNTSIPFFELGAELARAHERSAPGIVTVIPVVVDDLLKAKPVLAALAELAEGRLFQTGDPEFSDAVPMTSDVVRRRAIETALVEPGGVRRVVLFESAPGMLDARYEPATGTVPSAGEAVVLAAARAFAHAELDERELAIVAYSESKVDYPFRKSLWSLVVDQLPDLPHGNLRTLIVVAESTVEIPLHCQPGRGFRFAMTGPRMLRRHSKDDLHATVAQIAQHQRPIVFFLGAGFSASSRLPLGNGLRDAAIQRLLGIPDSEVNSSDALARRFHRWASERPDWLTDAERAMREDLYAQQLTLEQVIRAEKRYYPDLPTLQEFKAHHDSVIDTPGQAAKDFAQVVGALRGRVIVVEVNFDLLVEKHSIVPLNVFYTDEHFVDAAAYVRKYLAGDETQVPVLKVHGSIEDLDSCVASEEQTRMGVGAGKLEVLRSLTEHADLLWIYVGASMRDRNLLPVFKSLEFARKLDERWVSPFLDSTVDEFARERIPFWSSTSRKTVDDRLVSETADSFFSALRHELA